MRLALLALLVVIVAGCNGPAATGQVSVTPAPSASPTPDTGLVAIDNDGPDGAEVTLILLRGSVDRVALVFLNGTTRVRSTAGRVVRFDTGAGVIAAIEPIGQRVTAEQLMVGPGERRVVRLPSVAGATSLLIEVRNASLVDRVRTATGGWTVLSDAFLVKCGAGQLEHLELRLVRDGVGTWSSRC